MGSKNILSIEIGSVYTKLADIRVSGKKRLVKKIITLPTPKDACDDGFIEDRGKLCEDITGQLAKYGLGKRHAEFHISSSKIINREIVLPYVSKNKVDALIMANFSEFFPVDPLQYKVSWKLLERFTKDKTKKMRLMIVAMPLGLLESYYDVAKDLNLVVETVEYAGNAVYQMVKNVYKDINFISMDIGEDSTVISIIKSGILDFQRIIPQGMVTILDDMQAADGDFDYSTPKQDICDELRTRSCIYSQLPDDGAGVDVDLEEFAQKRIKNTAAFRNFIDRAETVIHYYTAAMTEGQLERMILTGPGSLIRNINQLFQNEMGLPVENMSLIKNIKLHPKANERVKDILPIDDSDNVNIPDDSVGMPVQKAPEEKFEMPIMLLEDVSRGLGALIEPMDFMNAAMKKRVAKKVSLVPGIVCALASVTVAAGMIGYAYIDNDMAVNTNTRLKSEINELEKVNSVITAHTEMAQFLTDVRMMVYASRNPDENIVTFIDELEEKLPVSAQVTAMSISETGVNLTVSAGSWVDAADAIKQLKSMETMQSVTVSAVNETEESSTAVNYVYYIDGVQVASLTDTLDTEGEVTVEEVPDDSVIKTYTFSAVMTWKSIPEPERLITEEQPEALTEAQTEAGGDDSEGE